MLELVDAEKDAVRKRQIIEAIKLVRARTGAGLKEAKDVVEAYRAQMENEYRLQIGQQPGEMQRRQDDSNARWHWVVVAVIVLFALVWGYWYLRSLSRLSSP